MAQENYHLNLLFGEKICSVVNKSEVLVVGAGGIGCELLKNLVYSGFRNLTVIDLDTIDLSNLNRQFLFRKHHVGQPKALVAAEAVKKFSPGQEEHFYHNESNGSNHSKKINIFAKQDNIKNSDYNMEFIKKFSLVLNALDNIDARRHVNRLCVAAGTTCIESGTQGYLGQVSVIRGGVTECYECRPLATPKTFAVCTIRNTPDKPIHCVVWAKFIFQTLFGPPDDSNILVDMKVDISRDSPSSACEKLFKFYFHDEIEKQRQVPERWKNRLPPQIIPYSTQSLTVAHDVPQTVESSVSLLRSSLEKLMKTQSSKKMELEFDKDNESIIDFVSALTNLRMFAFNITPLLSVFEVKGIAGNIIHAIASTNAIAAGLIVQNAIKILSDQFDKCSTTWIKRTGPFVLQPQSLEKPNKDCIVCGGGNPILTLEIDTDKFTVKQLFNLVCKQRLGFNEASIDVVSGDNFIGTEADQEDEEYLNKVLSSQGVRAGHGAQLSIEDLTQDVKVNIFIKHRTLNIEDPNQLLFTLTNPNTQPDNNTNTDNNHYSVNNNNNNNNSNNKRKFLKSNKEDDDLCEENEKKPKTVASASASARASISSISNPTDSSKKVTQEDQIVIQIE